MTGLYDTTVMDCGVATEPQLGTVLDFPDSQSSTGSAATLAKERAAHAAKIKPMPKIELHAHLFGSVTREFLLELESHDEALQDDPETVDLATAFDYFKWVYARVRDIETMELMTRDVLKNFNEDNVIYLELRTTLKSIPETGVNHDNYMEMLNRSIEWAELEFGMKTRLLLSVDRTKCQTRQSAEYQFTAIANAIKKHGKYVLGLDVCGDPQVENLSFALEQIDKVILDPQSEYHCLPWTCHTAELPRNEESWQILRRNPKRIGHGCYLTPEQMEYAKNKNIFVETCPSSNILTLELENIRQHPYAHWYADSTIAGLYGIATDDSGLFRTTLTDDLAIVVTDFGWIPSDLVNLQFSAINHSFLDKVEKTQLLSIFRQRICTWLNATL